MLEYTSWRHSYTWKVTILTSMRIRALRSESPISAKIHVLSECDPDQYAHPRTSIRVSNIHKYIIWMLEYTSWWHSYTWKVTILTSMRIHALRSESPISAKIHVLSECWNIHHDDIHMESDDPDQYAHPRTSIRVSNICKNTIRNIHHDDIHMESDDPDQYAHLRTSIRVSNIRKNTCIIWMSEYTSWRHSYTWKVTILTSMRICALRSESPISTKIISVCRNIHHDDIHIRHWQRRSWPLCASQKFLYVGIYIMIAYSVHTYGYWRSWPACVFAHFDLSFQYSPSRKLPIYFWPPSTPLLYSKNGVYMGYTLFFLLLHQT